MQTFESGVTLQDLGDSKGQIVSCLQDFRDTLMSMQCREQVHQVMARASEDMRFNQMLADACFNDREQFCSTTQQVSLAAAALVHLSRCTLAAALFAKLRIC